MLYLYTLVNKIIFDIQFRIWRKTHTMPDFEARMIELGCTKTHTRESVIFTTPNGIGKIEVTDKKIIINPK
jgi:hypothetical protein